MNKLLTLALLGSTIFTVQLSADGSCKMCERIREENKKKTNPYPYYEDYLKATGGKDQAAPAQSMKTEKSEPVEKPAPAAETNKEDKDLAK